MRQRARGCPTALRSENYGNAAAGTVARGPVNPDWVQGITRQTNHSSEGDELDLPPNCSRVRLAGRGRDRVCVARIRHCPRSDVITIDQIARSRATTPTTWPRPFARRCSPRTARRRHAASAVHAGTAGAPGRRLHRQREGRTRQRAQDARHGRHSRDPLPESPDSDRSVGVEPRRRRHPRHDDPGARARHHGVLSRRPVAGAGCAHASAAIRRADHLAISSQASQFVHSQSGANSSPKYSRM